MGTAASITSTAVIVGERQGREEGRDSGGGGLPRHARCGAATRCGELLSVGRLLRLPSRFSPPRLCHPSQGKAHRWIQRRERECTEESGRSGPFTFSMLRWRNGWRCYSNISPAFFACKSRNRPLLERAKWTMSKCTPTRAVAASKVMACMGSEEAK
jgi:hypothetical protein